MAKKTRAERINHWLTLGANIGVVLGLIVLIIEIRQNTEQARANASYQFLTATADLGMAIIENKQMASVVRRGMADFEALDYDEKTQFFFLIAQYYQTHANMYDLWRNHSLPETAWHVIRKDILYFMSNSGSLFIWEEYAREGQSPDFIAYVEALRSSGEGTYSLTDFIATKPSEEETRPGASE